MIEKTNTMKLIVRGILALLILAPAMVSAQDRYGETEEQQILCRSHQRLRQLQKAEELRRSLHPVEKGVRRVPSDCAGRDVL